MGLETKTGNEATKAKQEPTVDREKTCPFLLRVFYNKDGQHNSRNEYNRNMPGNELQIYTWLDATLKELMQLITVIDPDTEEKGTKFSFAVVWPYSNPRAPGFRMKDIGSTTMGQKGADDNMTLQAKKFVIGDFLDVAVTPARKAASGRDGGRDNRDGRDGGGRRNRGSYHDYR